MNHAVAVTLEAVPVRVVGLWIGTAPAVFDSKSELRQHSGARSLLGRQFAVDRESGLTDGTGFGTERIQQFAGFGRLLGADEARQCDGRLIRGDVDGGMRDQVA